MSQAEAPQDDEPRPAGGRSGGRRYRNSTSPMARRAARPVAVRTGGQPRAEASPFPGRMAPVGTVAGLLTACLVCCLLAAWLHVDAVAGLGFCAATCFAVRYARPEALLGVVVSIPVVFLTAEILAELATAGAHRGTLLPVLEGTLLTLADVAPWLFAGTVAGVVIAMCRGLPRCIRELRSDLSGRRPSRRPPVRNRVRRLARLTRGLLAQLPRQTEGHPLGHYFDLFDVAEPALG